LPAASAAGSSAAGGRPYDSLIASHAASNGVPAELVHRIVMRESRYRANAVGRGGASGLMQIKLATARSMGYTGGAAGLLDPETNLTYGVKYLAGAYRTAGGNHGRAVGYYASGYYYAAKRQRATTTAYAQATPAAAPVAMMSDATSEPTVMQREVRRKKTRR
jgi:soluble lytic murein transglycosylase-like protein